MRPPDRVCAEFGQPDVPDVSLLHQLRDRADRLLDRHLWVEPRRPVDIDMVDTQAHQRIGQEVLHRRRSGVQAPESAVRRTQAAELDREHDLIAAAQDGLADQHLVLTASVKVGRVDHIDPALDCLMDRGYAVGVLDRLAHRPRQARAAQAQGENRRS